MALAETRVVLEWAEIAGSKIYLSRNTKNMIYYIIYIFTKPDCNLYNKKST